MQDLTGWELQIVHAYKASGGISGSHGFETPDRTCLLGVRTALHDLTGSEHKIVHAYNVSGGSCRISQVGNYRSNMPTRHQEGTSGSHGFEEPDRTCLLGVRTALHDLRARNKRSYMPTRYPDEVARSHGFRTPDRTCLEGIRKGLQDLTGKEHQIVNAYEISPPAAGSHGFGTPDRTRLRGIRTGLQDLTGPDQQIQHAYKVSGRDCSISRIRHIRPNLPTRYQVGVAGSHRLGITDRTCLLGIRR